MNCIGNKTSFYLQLNFILYILKCLGYTFHIWAWSSKDFTLVAFGCLIL